MEESWEAQQSYEPKPNRTTIVLALIAAAALFSYLGCFAIVNALQKHEIMAPFAQGHDPRLRWFLISFGILATLFFGSAGLVQMLSHRKADEVDIADVEAE